MAAQLKGRRLGQGHVLLEMPPPGPFAALHLHLDAIPCAIPSLLVPSFQPREVAGGGRQHLQELAAQLAKSWAEVIKREAVGAFQGPTGWILFIAATH